VAFGHFRTVSAACLTAAVFSCDRTLDVGDNDSGAPCVTCTDAGAADAGQDAGSLDSGMMDAGAPDSGVADAGPPADAGEPDAGEYAGTVCFNPTGCHWSDADGGALAMGFCGSTPVGPSCQCLHNGMGQPQSFCSGACSSSVAGCEVRNCGVIDCTSGAQCVAPNHCQ
jgi:hypothetical protein